jgi:hypothetical protein
MVDTVDGVIIDDFDSVAYNHHLARPYLEAGMPTFINRTFTDSVRKAKEMLGLAKRHGAPIMTGSSYEFVPQIHVIRAKIKREEITGYEAWHPCSDYYTHGIHGVWGAYAAVGGGIEAVALDCKNWLKSEGAVTSIFYRNRGKGAFSGAIHEGMQPNEAPHTFNMILQPGNQAFPFTSTDPWGMDEFMWLPMLHRIQWMFETGEQHEPHDDILEKSALFTGAFYSHLERNGARIRLADLPEDWAIGSAHGFSKPGSIEQYEKLFGKEKGYLQAR